MNHIPYDVVAFDLDGTLADTAPDLTAALNHTLGALGRDALPADSILKMVGHGARALLRTGLAATGTAPDELVDQGFPIFIDYYSANICNGTTAYGDLEDALDALAASGTRLAICTNKPESLTLQLVETLGWKDRFASIVGGDTLPVKKPDPAPLREAIARAGGGKAAFVGDSITDADTARAARVPFVAVSFGYSDRPVEQLGADVIIHRYSELLDALASL